MMTWQDTLGNSVSDTIVKVSDTINLNISNAVELFQGNDPFIVKTFSEPQSLIDQYAPLVGVIAAIVTIIYTFIALKKLLSNDKQLQSQIDELVKLNNLFERRLRMSVKPQLFINGSETYGKEKKLAIHIYNRGEIAFYSGYEFLGGEDVIFNEWEQDIEIEKDGRIVLSGNTFKNPSNILFQLKIKYYDKEKYQYESIVQWNNGNATIIENTEL